MDELIRHDTRPGPGPQPGAERDTTAGREGWVCFLAAAIAMMFAAFFVIDSVDFGLDDAWIHLDYAKSLRRGEGMSYNPGDWETGFSSPLWVLVLAAWPLGDDPVMSVKLLGVLLHGATAYAAAALTLALGVQRATVERPLPLLSLTLLAGVAVGTCPPLLQGATSGMEVPLCAALVFAATRSMIVGHVRASALGGVLAVLARPEALGYITALGIVLWAWRRRTRPPGAARAAPLAAVLAAAATLGVWLLYCQIVSGDPWPNPYLIKAGSGSSEGLVYVAEEVLPWQPWLVALTPLLLVGLGLRNDLRVGRPELLAILIAAVATTLAIALSRPLHPGVQFYESRYFAPFLAVVAATLPFGFVGCHRLVAAALGLPFAVATGLQVSEVHRVTAAAEHDTRSMHTEVARYLAASVPASAVVAVEGAGATRFLLPRSVTVLDIVGLNDHRAALLRADGPAKLCYLAARGPTHLVIPEDFVPPFARAFRLKPLQTFADPHYTQVQPPRSLRVFVFAVAGLNPPWAERCATLADRTGRSPERQRGG